MASSYTAALIGCGGISHSHAKAYIAQGNVELVAACDIHEGNLKNVSGEYNIPNRYDLHEKLFEDHPGLDIVSVCTFPKAHAEQTIAAANADAKAVLCEKPMCLGLDEADAMIDACDRSETKLVIAHRHRQNPNFIEARDRIASGVIGEPRLAWCYLTSCIIDNGTHIVDLIRFLLGDPKTSWVMGHVSRKGETYYQESPAEESGLGLIAFESGTRAILEMGELTLPDGFHFRIVGTEGMIETTISDLKLYTSSGFEDLSQEPNTGFDEQTCEMIQWLEGGPEHRSTGHHGRATTEILLGIHESARLGEVVHMPLGVSGYPMLARSR